MFEAVRESALKQVNNELSSGKIFRSAMPTGAVMVNKKTGGMRTGAGVVVW